MKTLDTGLHRWDDFLRDHQLWIEKFALLLYPSKIEVKNLLTPSALSSEDQNEIRYSRKNSEIFYRSDYDLHYRLYRICIHFLFLFH